MFLWRVMILICRWLLSFSNIEIIEGRDLRAGDSGKVALGYNYLLKNKIFSEGLCFE